VTTAGSDGDALEPGDSGAGDVRPVDELTVGVVDVIEAYVTGDQIVEIEASLQEDVCMQWHVALEFVEPVYMP
jgi:hypothetical protein